jgi:F-type H+-transporting ATPase subunit epsilon
MAHNEASAAGAALRCVVVTPERAVLDEPSDFVALPLYDGELGILPGRLPLIGRLGFGEMRLVRGQQTQRYYVDGGFAQVRDNVVTVLTARAVAATEILVETARADLQMRSRPSPRPPRPKPRKTGSANGPAPSCVSPAAAR